MTSTNEPTSSQAASPSATDPGGDPSASSSLRDKAILGAFWTISSYGLSQVFRFGSNIVLAWLLSPKDFGLMALVVLAFNVPALAWGVYVRVRIEQIRSDEM